MRRAIFCVIAVLEAGVFVVMAGAQERSAPAGAIAVRPIRVRELRVDAPPPSSREEQHRGRGVERPAELALISRPVHHPPLDTTSALQSKRYARSHAPSRAKVVGYPVVYPYAYPVDPFSPTPTGIESAPRNSYSNADSAPVGSPMMAGTPQPGAVACELSAACGGISFQIRPANAQVNVDGEFVGLVSDFGDPAAPLLLAPGDHYIEVRLAGYRTASFDLTVAAGDLTPYQGVLQRLRQRRP